MGQKKLMQMELGGHLKVFTDGASRGNPGPAAIGIVFYNHQNQVVGRI